MNIAYNMDCMEYMRSLPDKAFDLAVVDPPYGGGATAQEREREKVPRPADGIGGTVPFGETWISEPDVGRVVNGLPDRVDRIKCLGNAVVPQQFYPIFKAIADIERQNYEHRLA